MANRTKFTVLGIVLIILSLAFINQKTQASEPSKTNTVEVYRIWSQNSKTKVCDVQYYVKKDTFFVNQRFRVIGFVFSDKATRRIILMQQTSVFRRYKNTNWWFAVVNKRTVKKPTNSTLTVISLRDCLYKTDPHKVHRSADAYLYNASSEVPSWHGSKTLNSNLKQLIKNF